MSTNKLRQAIPNHPDITLPTQAGLIVNTQFSEPFCVYGAYSDGREGSQMYEGKHNNETGSECYRSF